MNKPTNEDLALQFGANILSLLNDALKAMDNAHEIPCECCSSDERVKEEMKIVSDKIKAQLKFMGLK